ncbi:LysE family translocator [Actinomycetes bacterium M1A6_2h]
MITLSAAAGVAVVALGMVLTPGPNMMYLISRSASQGKRAGFVSLGGVGVGFLVYLVAATLGISAVFAAVPSLYLAVKLAGAAYLGWLAWKAFRPGGISILGTEGMPHDTTLRLFTMGLTTNLLNPKIAVMYVALIPQFVDPNAGRLWLQSLALGSVQIAIALVVNALVVLAAGSISTFVASRPSWLRIQRYLMGTVLGLLALRVATDGSRPAPA